MRDFGLFEIKAILSAYFARREQAGLVEAIRTLAEDNLDEFMDTRVRSSSVTAWSSGLRRGVLS